MTVPSPTPYPPSEGPVIRLLALIPAAMAALTLCLPADAVSPMRLRALIYRSDPCLAHIVDHEDRSWSATRYGLGGSYGLPQASPPSKMASAGADWRTNPWTQLRWMRRYVNGRYGGSCAAWAWWQAHRWY